MTNVLTVIDSEQLDEFDIRLGLQVRTRLLWIVRVEFGVGVGVGTDDESEDPGRPLGDVPVAHDMRNEVTASKQREA
jgi:hypothetical protein